MTEREIWFDSYKDGRNLISRVLMVYITQSDKQIGKTHSLILKEVFRRNSKAFENWRKRKGDATLFSLKTMNFVFVFLLDYIFPKLLFNI